MLKIFEQFVVLKPNMEMDKLQVGPELYDDLDKNYGGFESHCLVSAHKFTEDWPTWEIHPKGDEMVILLDGSARFILKKELEEETVEMEEPGSFLVVPKNTWHTAKVSSFANMLFITPGEGTLNEFSPTAVV